METLKRKSQTKNPRKDASVLSKLTFWYMSGIFAKGHKQKLELSDMFMTVESLSSRRLAETAEREYQKEKQLKEGKKSKPNLLTALLKSNKLSMFLLGLGTVYEETVNIISAYLVGFLIEYFTPKSKINRNEAFAYATGIAVVTFINGLLHHSVSYHLELVGLKIRTAITSMLYKKVTSLSQAAFTNTSVGNVVNLVSSDAQRLLLALFFFNYFWVAPLKLFIITGLLVSLLGVSALPGVALLVLFVPLQICIGNLFSHFRRKIGDLTDERVKITSELITGMRAIKMYTWEKPFAKIIAAARKREAKKILQAETTRAINVSTFICMPYLSAAAIFITHYLRGKTLDTTIVFSTLALLQLLRFTLGLFFPMAVQRMAEGLVSSSRVQSFLELDEMQCKNLITKNLTSEDPEPTVVLNHVNASWQNPIKSWNGLLSPRVEVEQRTHSGDEIAKQAKDSLTLKDISLKLSNKKSLLMIVGPVGAGKTSILMSLCGEIPIVDGNIEIKGKIAYASQKPWIFSGTVRQNILFGEEFDVKRYEKTINACALTEDFKQFQNGDLTLVGERGVCISGGQKARIGLARAVYRDADVYLLDDPLSAVDTKVGKHLFEQCICGLLKHKIRILTTHQIQYLKAASEILCIREGKPIRIGTYEEIHCSDLDVQSLLSEASISEEAIERHCSQNEVSQDDVELRQRRVTLRSNSIISRQDAFVSEENVDFNEKDTFEDENTIDELEEKTKEGNVGFNLYFQYFRAGGGYFMTIVMFLLCIVNQLSLTGVDWWLGYWSKAEELKSKNQSVSQLKYYFKDNEKNNLYAYIVWTFVTCSLVFLSVTFFYNVAVNASKNLHNKMLNAILKTPVYFFDTTPTGRILNRFAKDTFFMDEELPWTFQDFIMYALFSINAVVVSCVNVPYMLIIMLPLTVAFFYLRSYYLVTARSVKRLEGISRSPMFAHLSSTLEGLPTIRAFKTVDIVTKEFYDCQDHQADGWYMFLSTSRWFGQRLDVLVVIFVIFAVFAPLVLDQYTSIDPTFVGLSLVYALQLCIFFQWCVRQSAQVENLMTSTERIFEYCELAPEPDTKSNDSISADWPKHGEIRAENASFSYHEDLPVVLKDLSFCIKAGEKVGVVGRTGAGKSSLISAMFRMGHLMGTIKIDDVATSEISLLDLRGHLSVIPQDPVLFSGSLRMNIDPFTKFGDIDIWDVLEQVQLKDAVVELPNKLSTDVSEGGSNFSVGQRQLLCLARALLLRKKILFIDEATANVDNETDSQIQETIREKFQDCTVVTVAHRLNTIMDCDRIMVMEAGHVIQFDEPCTLFEEKNGLFYKLVEQTGEDEAAKLERMAYEAKNFKEMMTERTRAITVEFECTGNQPVTV